MVGVSLGGIICHDYAHHHGSDEVIVVLTLGAPFRGSRLSSFGLSKVARSLHVDNPWLARSLEHKPTSHFTSIYSCYDQIVIPYSNSHHPDANENKVIATTGHCGFYFEPSVLTMVARWVKERLG